MSEIQETMHRGIPCSDYQVFSSVHRVESGYWFALKRERCQGGVLLVHGLNMNPASWNEMIAFLNQLGLSVYRLELKGHRGLEFSDMADVTAEGWLAQCNSAIEFMMEKLPGLPLFLIGYSLGGLLGVVVQVQRNKPCFERQVLLAPALALKLYTRLAVPLTRVVPSLGAHAPRSYVANPEGATGAAYRALFDLERKMRTSKERELVLVNSPTLIFMRPNDELISYWGMKKIIARNKLDRWRLTPLPRKKCSYRELPFHHLLVDEKSVGEQSWQKMTRQVENFFVRA